jgi:hypothetical protein
VKAWRCGRVRVQLIARTPYVGNAAALGGPPTTRDKGRRGARSPVPDVPFCSAETGPRVNGEGVERGRPG